MQSSSKSKSFRLTSLFSFAGPVDRRCYISVGFFLVLLKYLVESVVIFTATGRKYTPVDFVNPLLSSREYFADTSTPWLGMAWILWSIPFFWIAVAMSIRRASDIGVSPWFGLMILVPIFNWFGILVMSLFPTAIPKPTNNYELEKLDEAPLINAAGTVSLDAFHNENSPRILALKMSESVDFEDASYDGVSAAALGIGGGAIYAIAMVLFSVYVLGNYGAAMFFGTPVVTGAIASFLYNRGTPKTIGRTLGHASLTMILACTGFLCVGIEGIICIAMAVPIMMPLVLFGALIGMAIAMTTANPNRSNGTGMTGCLVVLPFLAALEPNWQATPTFEVMTSVEIAATPDVVWKRVIDFPDITAEEEWFFAMGIASPQRARIDGEGVGANRHCEFTTGTFVEPITIWNPPSHLAFDVSEQPDPMVELSPYRHLHPPHLDHSFRSTKGEFRLINLGHQRTRLEARTWYQLEIYPLGYWALWSDWIVHRIHLRVLKHIQRITESQENRDAK